MKIGILTLTLHTNYGGILQAYALQTVLERMGHEVIVFNKYPVKKRTNFIVLIKRIIYKLLGRKVIVFSEIKNNKEAPFLNKNIMEFRQEYLHEIYLNTSEEIGKLNLDCIVVGSDQIWRPKYYKEQWRENVDNAFLAFTKGWKIKRVAYAASFGTDEWEYDDVETNDIKKAIMLFDSISVRELSGVRIVKEKLNADATFVLDPTMLLHASDYEKIVSSYKTPKSKGNLLVYILDPNDKKTEILELVLLQQQFTPFYINRDNIPLSEPLENRIKPGVDIWLRGFMDAEFVITDSFHACVFSLLFNKPFVVIGNSARGMARFHSLLSIFDQNYRLVTGEDGYMTNEKRIHSSPNANIKILQEGIRSLNFLSNSLK